MNSTAVLIICTCAVIVMPLCIISMIWFGIKYNQLEKRIYLFEAKYEFIKNVFIDINNKLTEHQIDLDIDNIIDNLKINNNINKNDLKEYLAKIIKKNK